METIWVFTVIIAGVFSPTPGSKVEGFIGGEVENTSSMFFESEKACKAARDLMVSSKNNILQGLDEADITITNCTASKFTVK